MDTNASKMAADENNWRTNAFRQSVVAKIDEAIQRSGMPTTKNSMEMENHVFQKAKSKEEYLGFVARLILHVREMNSKKGGGMGGPAGAGGQPMQDPINALTTLARQGTGNPQMMGMGVPPNAGMVPQPQSQIPATNHYDLAISCDELVEASASIDVEVITTDKEEVNREEEEMLRNCNAVDNDAMQADWADYTPRMLKKPVSQVLQTPNNNKHKRITKSNDLKGSIGKWAGTKLQLVELQKSAHQEQHQLKMKLMQEKNTAEIEEMQKMWREEWEFKKKLLQEEHNKKLEILELEKSYKLKLLEASEKV